MSERSAPPPTVEGRLREALEATTDCVVVLDRNFRVVFINRKAAALSHLRPEDVIGRTHGEIWPMSVGTEVERRYRTAIETGVPQEFRNRYVDEGHDFWLDVCAHPSEGGLILFYRDVTDRVREQEALAQVVADSERQRRLYETILGATPDLVYVFDLQHRFTYANAALLAMWGRTAEDAIGKNCLEIGYEPWHAEMHGNEIDEIARTKRPIRGVVPFCGTNGRRMYDYILVPVLGEDGEVEAVAGTTRDVTDRIAAEEALRENAERSRLIVESVPEIAWTARPDGHVDDFNERWFEYTGLSPDDDWRTAIHPDDRSAASEAWAKSADSGAPYETEMRLRQGTTGAYRWFVARARPLRDAEGGIVRWFGITSDVHELKETQQALAVANRLGAALAENLDPERVVQTLTDASTEAVGAEFGSFFYAQPDKSSGPDDDRFGLYVLSGAPREVFESFPPVRATPLFAPTFRGEGVVRSDDVAQDPRFSGMPAGHLPVRSYLAVSVRARDGGVLGGLLFGHSEPNRFTEVHQRMVESFAAQASIAYENAILYGRLREAKANLERKVRERTADLQASNEALQGFTYHVSHDLRAPLRSIVSASRIVQEDFGDLLPAEAHALLDRQAEAASKLGQLIDDLLKLSRLSQAEIEKRPLDLSGLAQEAASEALSSHPDTTVQVVVADGLKTEADPSLVRLALGNLIENGVKYSPAGGVVSVGLHENGAFYVADEGIGIDPKYFGKIFEPFQRLHRDDEFAGTGIGLSNVRQVVERHGGRIWVESAPGRGSTFFFTLS